MCELLNRIWSRPRGEWTRVLRRELPALAAGIVEELQESIPGFRELIADSDEEVVRQRVETALLTALGYREPSCRPEGERPETAAGPEREPSASGQLVPLKAIPSQRSPEAGVTAAERARRELFTGLTADMPMSEIALSELAAAAGWPLPATVRAVAPATPGEMQQLAGVLDDALTGMVGGQPCLLVPAPDPEARGPLECALRGRFAAVGHPVPLRDTASSLRWALRLLNLTPARPGAEVRAVFVDDHLSTLLLLQDEPLAHALAARWLRPLADLTPRQSERLEVTLLAWLEGGGAPEAAKALSVHPQTVRYRMRQLEKLFGTGLRDPRTRFELEMALRTRRLMAQVRRQHSRVSRRARVVTAEFRPPLGAGRMARVNGL
ncbi:helix-turn-helix domain-containing protein [Streptomyces sp. NPDC046161]|uniref:PucR family transcriptional regulator n=1 Tax=Streptomyces sp. NPDC046161 TaxID=3155132 RepID=UPI003411CDDC